MNFILKMAWRDSRRARGRLALFSLSVVLGIAALVAIGSFSANLSRGMAEQTKALLGADLIVTSRVAFTPAVEAFLQTLGGEEAREVSASSMMVFPTAGGATRLVQARAIEGAFPFYGEFDTEPANALARLRRGEKVVILEATLLPQFNVKMGDHVKLGKERFEVAGAVTKVAGENAAVAMLAPRAFFPLGRLEATGLAGPGSLVRHRVMLKLPAGRDAEAVARELRERFPEQRLSVETVAMRQRQLGRALTNIYGFLSLVGFIALFLGAIGVASAIHVYVQQKITTVAILRCLGASARQSFAVYVVQGCALGALGAVLGAALGIGVQRLLPGLVQDWLPWRMDFFIAWPAVGRGMAAGFVICVLFALLPLLAVRRVSPLAALRSALAEPAKRAPDPWRITIGVAIGGAVWGFALWQTRSIALGVGFAGSLAVGFGVLWGAARGVAWAAKRWRPRGLPYVVRQGIANLHRPNNRTVLLLVSLGLGTFLMLTLYLSRTTLLQELKISGEGGQPNLMFLDVQDDQVATLRELAEREKMPLLRTAPIVTMKVAAVRGRPVAEMLKDRTSPVANWTLRREYRSTYRGELSETEKLVAGKFSGQVAADVAVIPISLEQDLAKDMHVKLGDEIEWDVQGVPLKTRVTSLRTVEWRRLEPNFFVVFPLGVLEGAPKFYLAAAHAATPADSARLQQVVVHALPNVSAIDLATLVQTLDSIFSKVALVIEFMALFTVATGLVVLAGAVLTGRYQRIRETVLLRTLGASQRQLGQIQLVEYAALGALAAILGGGLAVGANALLAKYVFETTAAISPGALAVAGVGVVVVTLLTGVWSSRGLATHPPLEVLRQEV
ncbi:ABC transporter permease [Horticoccus luteus]|uniref:ABC transporter permease n=1 Tax=Horticoccus luteus TaxID=2862869 RepID=A0A8F9XK71_9BACT|nr:FtsX-like permease family protein [Horticoccus luteus]QYM79403.1 ABC transporter permease [Horticoccus luteus]